MFTAPAPPNLGEHRGQDAAAAILGGEASPHPRDAQGGDQSPAQLVRETPPAMASRPKSPAGRTGDTEVLEVSDDSGDDGDGENLRRGDVFDEDSDDFDEGIIGADSEGESDEEPNGDAPVVDLTGDSDDSLSNSDSLRDVDGVAGGGPNDDMDAFSSGSEVEIVDEVHVVPDEHENPPPAQHGGGGRGGGRVGGRGGGRVGGMI